MSVLYLERYLNYGLTREELQSGKPIIGIAQTGSDLSPCNRHHIELTKRLRDGIIAAGGTTMAIPVHPIQESHSPWQQYFREKVGPFSQGMVLKGAPDYRDIAKKHIPRNNHWSLKKKART